MLELKAAPPSRGRAAARPVVAASDVAVRAADVPVPSTLADVLSSSALEGVVEVSLSTSTTRCSKLGSHCHRTI